MEWWLTDLIITMNHVNIQGGHISICTTDRPSSTSIPFGWLMPVIIGVESTLKRREQSIRSSVSKSSVWYHHISSFSSCFSLSHQRKSWVSSFLSSFFFVYLSHPNDIMISSDCNHCSSPVPPEEPVISDMDGTELKGLVGPFNEGDELKLVCSTNGGEDDDASWTSSWGSSCWCSPDDDLHDQHSSH